MSRHSVMLWCSWSMHWQKIIILRWWDEGHLCAVTSWRSYSNYSMPKVTWMQFKTDSVNHKFSFNIKTDRPEWRERGQSCENLWLEGRWRRCGQWDDSPQWCRAYGRTARPASAGEWPSWGWAGQRGDVAAYSSRSPGHPTAAPTDRYSPAHDSRCLSNERRKEYAKLV